MLVILLGFVVFPPALHASVSLALSPSVSYNLLLEEIVCSQAPRVGPLPGV